MDGVPDSFFCFLRIFMIVRCFFLGVSYVYIGEFVFFVFKDKKIENKSI